MSSAFGNVQTPATVGGNEEPAIEVAERKKDEKVHEYADKRLQSLVKSDEMYYAMEYFLLGDPERQISQLGDSETLLKQGDESKAKDQIVYARTNYETAAKIAIYRGDKEMARKCLVKAQEVTEQDDKRYRLMTTLIDGIDEATSVARSYYNILKTDVIPNEAGQNPETGATRSA
jgi:hypothetical protein